MTVRDTYDPFFPWDHLGLRANPFQSLRIDDWVEIAILPGKLSAWYAEPSAVLQISGEKGVGKSSALFALQKILRTQAFNPEYAYIPLKRSKTQIDLDHPGPLLIDEAQRLSVSLRRKLLQRKPTIQAHYAQTPSLIYTTHVNFKDDLRRLSIDFKSIHLSVLNHEDLTHLLERRVRYFSSDESCEVRFHPKAVDFLSRTFGSNLRQMEAYLYDFFQAIPSHPLISAQQLERHLNS
jgi:hypothetical protein